MNPWDLIILGHDHGGWMGDFLGFKSYPPVWLWQAVPKEYLRDYDRRAEQFSRRMFPYD